MNNNMTFFGYLTSRLGEETTASFERRAGLRAGTVQNWRRGASPSRTSLIRVAKAFGEPYENWLKIARETKEPGIREGRTRRNSSWLERV